jgi:hypothetical protein
LRRQNSGFTIVNSRKISGLWLIKVLSCSDPILGTRRCAWRRLAYFGRLALAYVIERLLKNEKKGLVWFWIGPHDRYEQLIEPWSVRSDLTKRSSRPRYRAAAELKALAVRIRVWCNKNETKNI